MENLHEVEINFTERADPECFIKIDGKEIRHTKGIVIKSPLASKDGHTTVEISFFAKVKGKAKGKIIKKNA